MILGQGEIVILQSSASMRHGWADLFGVLTLTNVRLVFEAGAGGPAPTTTFAELLDKVWNLHAGRQATKEWFHYRVTEYLTLEGSFGRVVFAVANAPAWATAIYQGMSNLAATARPPPPPSTAPGNPLGQGPLVVQVQAPPPPVVMMQCRHCGNLFDVTKGRCDRCGAPPST